VKHHTSLRTAIYFVVSSTRILAFCLDFDPSSISLQPAGKSPTTTIYTVKTMAPSSSSNLAHIQEVEHQRRQGALSSIYFGAVIGGLIFVFAVAHWSKRLLNRPQIRSTTIGRTFATWLVPLTRHLYGRKVYGIDVIPERVAIAIVYFGANIGVSIWGINWQHMSHITIFANRLGW
jgi:hypothetical protein